MGHIICKLCSNRSLQWRYGIKYTLTDSEVEVEVVMDNGKCDCDL